MYYLFISTERYTHTHSVHVKFTANLSFPSHVITDLQIMYAIKRNIQGIFYNQRHPRLHCVDGKTIKSDK